MNTSDKINSNFISSSCLFRRDWEPFRRVVLAWSRCSSGLVAAVGCLESEMEPVSTCSLYIRWRSQVSPPSFVSWWPSLVWIPTSITASSCRSSLQKIKFILGWYWKCNTYWIGTACSSVLRPSIGRSQLLRSACHRRQPPSATHLHETWSAADIQDTRYWELWRNILWEGLCLLGTGPGSTTWRSYPPSARAIGFEQRAHRNAERKFPWFSPSSWAAFGWRIHLSGNLWSRCPRLGDNIVL